MSRVEVSLDLNRLPGRAALANATVAVNAPGTGQHIAGPLYQGKTGTATLSNPFTVTNGNVDFYLGYPQLVDLVITPASQPAIAVPSVPVTTPVRQHQTLSLAGKVMGWFTS